MLTEEHIFQECAVFDQFFSKQPKFADQYFTLQSYFHSIHAF